MGYAVLLSAGGLEETGNMGAYKSGRGSLLARRLSSRIAVMTRWVCSASFMCLGTKNKSRAAKGQKRSVMPMTAAPDAQAKR